MKMKATHLLIFQLLARDESAEFWRETFHKAQSHARLKISAILILTVRVKCSFW
jgi:hypothetical protein